MAVSRSQTPVLNESSYSPTTPTPTFHCRSTTSMTETSRPEPHNARQRMEDQASVKATEMEPHCQSKMLGEWTDNSDSLETRMGQLSLGPEEGEALQNACEEGDDKDSGGANSSDTDGNEGFSRSDSMLNFEAQSQAATEEPNWHEEFERQLPVAPYTGGRGGFSGHSSDDEDAGDASDEETDSNRGEPQACLFVASLAASRTDVQLIESVTEHFKKWGPLLNVKVLKDWMQRPYSFVQFERTEDAKRAMIEAQNTIIDGRHIRIEQARVNRTLFIVRFARSLTEKDLTEVLQRYGPLEDVSIFHDYNSVQIKRYAFAKYSYRDDAIKAYISLRSGSKWNVEWAPNLPSDNQVEVGSIFVGQLNPLYATEQTIKERFSPYGTIKEINLVSKNKQGANRKTAFAFIAYTSESSADDAVQAENNTDFQGRTIRVQHRETNEYRVQRQNAAQQAAHTLIAPHVVRPVGNSSSMNPPPVMAMMDPTHGYPTYHGPPVRPQSIYGASQFAYRGPSSMSTSPMVMGAAPDPRNIPERMSLYAGTSMATPDQGTYYCSPAAYRPVAVPRDGSCFEGAPLALDYAEGYAIPATETYYYPYYPVPHVYMYEPGPAHPSASRPSLGGSTGPEVPSSGSYQMPYRPVSAPLMAVNVCTMPGSQSITSQQHSGMFSNGYTLYQPTPPVYYTTSGSSQATTLSEGRPKGHV